MFTVVRRDFKDGEFKLIVTLAIAISAVCVAMSACPISTEDFLKSLQSVFPVESERITIEKKYPM